MQKFFSIIIPVYNVDSYIENTINSVIKQNCSNYQLIIIDDGSTDETCNICERLYENHKDHIIFKRCEHKGVSASRNEGLKIATGEYIMFMDGDDYLVKGALNYIYSILSDAYPDLLLFDFARLTFPDDFITNIDYNTNNILISTNEAINIKLKEKTIPCFASCIKVSMIKENNIIFDEDLTYVEDALFIFKCMLASNSIIYNNNILYLYLQRPDSLTHLIKVPSNIYAMEIKAWERIRKIISFDNSNKYLVNNRIKLIKEKYYKTKIKELIGII